VSCSRKNNNFIEIILALTKASDQSYFKWVTVESGTNKLKFDPQEIKLIQTIHRIDETR
jgi:hypothetical protein